MHSFRDDATYYQLLGNGKACVECVLAFILSLGFQLTHKASCSEGGSLTRHSHYARVRLGGLTIWRLQCTACKAVFTVLPHFALRYRQMRPAVARDALLATHGGLSLEWCAVLCNLSPMALYRLVCAFGRHSLVTVLTRCGLPLPLYVLADEKHSKCLTDKVYLPTLVRRRVIWHLGYTTEASVVAFTQSYGEFQCAASQQDPSYQVKGVLTDGFDSTNKSLRTLFPGVRLGTCLRHALIIRPSFIPPPPIQALRELTRTRVGLIQTHTHAKNRVTKVLEDTNIKVASVVADLFGVSGRRMLAALIAGERNPQILASLAVRRLRHKLPQLEIALTGQFTEHHARLIQLALELVDLLDRQIATLDQQIGALAAPLAPQREPLTSLPGVETTAARAILAEIGTDMHRFSSDTRLAS